MLDNKIHKQRFASEFLGSFIRALTASVIAFILILVLILFDITQIYVAAFAVPLLFGVVFIAELWSRFARSN